ncbi:GNAT family N-acetyltransferase [Fulvimarina endophytica]|uniref:GNAT family N-acetyltransferase n=1 Tax=Fulvimarina endophytica TaxID=2293836 RepID=A0A371X1D3_9HYPH|nr:GNAT family N-acetyltransferase [Fulvimarina endophytica]RFC63050.1 GNAT family N-acetyltransferase [Fulvimarina endophytica]
MTTTVTDIRLADETDSAGLERVHAASWRQAYTGIIPFRELNAMISRRDTAWWARAIHAGAQVLVCSFGGTTVGYATFGPNRTAALAGQGEIYELYLDPVFQGVGLGRRLFGAARRRLSRDGLDSFLVWTLAENLRAVDFYGAMGGVRVATGTERFGARAVDKAAFRWA